MFRRHPSSEGVPVETLVRTTKLIQFKPVLERSNEGNLTTPPIWDSGRTFRLSTNA